MNNNILIFIVGYLLLMTPALHASDIQPRIVGGNVSAQTDWPFMVALMNKSDSMSVNGELYTSEFMQGSPTSFKPGLLINCDQGATPCENASEKVCLIERGGQFPNGEDIFFFDKAKNCAAGGGVSAIVYNNVAGLFSGTVGTATIPILSVSRTDGLSLLNQLNQKIEFVFLDSIPTKSFCGGTYVGGKWVITAAHCVIDVDSDSLTLNIGGFNLRTNQDNIFDVAKIFIHEGFTFPSLTNDIAIIELKTTPQNIRPALLPNNTLLSQYIASNDPVTALGRGTQSVVAIGGDAPGEFFDPKLYQVDVNLVSNTECKRKMGFDKITDDMLCAGNLAGGVGTCFGDSGGPLLHTVSGNDYLVGITSWGFGCAQPDVYGVYSRAPYIKADIDALLNGQLLTRLASPTLVSSTSNENGGSLNILFLSLLFLVRLRSKQR